MKLHWTNWLALALSVTALALTSLASAVEERLLRPTLELGSALAEQSGRSLERSGALRLNGALFHYGTLSSEKPPQPALDDYVALHRASSRCLREPVAEGVWLVCLTSEGEDAPDAVRARLEARGFDAPGRLDAIYARATSKGSSLLILETPLWAIPNLFHVPPEAAARFGFEGVTELVVSDAEDAESPPLLLVTRSPRLKNRAILKGNERSSLWRSATGTLWLSHSAKASPLHFHLRLSPQ